MNNPDLKSTFVKAIHTIKKIMDAIIVSIFLAIPLILVLGAINAIFEIDAPMRIGGRQTAGLGSDFGLVLRMTLAFAVIGAILVVLRHGVTIWRWLRSRPLVGGLVGLVGALLIAAWLIFAFQKTSAEQLAVAIGDDNLDRVQKILRANTLEADYLDLQLSRSVEEGKFEIAAALIDGGANIDRATAFGEYSLLVSTIMFGEVEAIYFLIEQGADPNQVDEFGRTPLITLVDFRLPKESMQMDDGVAVARALLLAGADRSKADTFGKTAKDYAEERGYQRLIPLL